MTGPSDSPPWTLRRARPADAEAFARLMSEPNVFANLLQMPFPDADLWRKRLSDQVSVAHSTELHLVAEVQGEVIASAMLDHTQRGLEGKRQLDPGG